MTQTELEQARLFRILLIIVANRTVTQQSTVKSPKKQFPAAVQGFQALNIQTILFTIQTISLLALITVILIMITIPTEFHTAILMLKILLAILSASLTTQQASRLFLTITTLGVFVLPITGDLSIANINPMRYKGYYYDSDTGMYYLQSRYYDPSLKRFINADDAELIADLALESVLGGNIFAYCENNAVNFIDESGNTCYYFYGKDQEYHAKRNINLIQKKYSSVVGYLITSENMFTQKWNQMGRTRGGRGSQKKRFGNNKSTW